MYNFLTVLFILLSVPYQAFSSEIVPITSEIKAFLDQVNSNPAKPIATVPIQEGRLGYEKIAVDYNGIPVSISRIDNIQIPSNNPSRSIPIRVYIPKIGGKLPVIIYFHGGGWQRGSLNTHDSICRRMANKVECVVIAVDYRLAPENRFPAGLNDCFEVYNWVLTRGIKTYKLDFKHIVIAGDSSGGNLAAALSFKLKAENKRMPALQVLFYPVLDLKMSSESYKKFSSGYLLTSDSMKYYVDSYINSLKDIDNLLASPLAANDFRGLPPTYIITAGYDPLHDDGAIYAKKLKENDSKVTYKCYENMIHGFLHFTGLFPEVEGIVDEISLTIKEQLKASRIGKTENLQTRL